MSVVVWSGFALAVFDLLLWFALAYGLRRAWRMLRPQVEPLLSIFAKPPPAAEPQPPPDE